MHTQISTNRIQNEYHRKITFPSKTVKPHIKRTQYHDGNKAENQDVPRQAALISCTYQQIFLVMIRT